MTVKTIIGYEIEPGVSPEEYDQWLFEVHVPDLLANPHLDRIVFNTVLRAVDQASGGSAAVPEGVPLFRIAELHFANEDAYDRYVAWFAEHPIPGERGPKGRTAFRFYVVTSSIEVTR